MVGVRATSSGQPARVGLKAGAIALGVLSGFALYPAPSQSQGISPRSRLLGPTLSVRQSDIQEPQAPENQRERLLEAATATTPDRSRPQPDNDFGKLLNSISNKWFPPAGRGTQPSIRQTPLGTSFGISLPYHLGE